MNIKDRYNIHKAKNGSAEHFEKLVKEHYITLYRFALSITRGNTDLASDVLQSALLKAFRSINSFKGESSFTSWLWVIIKNEFITYSRSGSGRIVAKSSSIENDLEDERSESAETSITEQQRKENLYALIDELSEKYREVILMVELSGMSYVETSEFLGIPVGSVKSRLSRAKTELKKLIEQNRELF